MKKFFPLATAAVVVVATLAVGAQRAAPTGARGASPNPQDWIQLFNGRNLDDWIIKFAKHDLGENFNDTFRVENGLLKVSYDKWTRFNGEFGHIFYKDPFCTTGLPRNTGLSGTRFLAAPRGPFAITA